MAQPDGLALTRADLRDEIARFMSFGTYTQATTQSQRDINAFIRRGLRQFYNPQPMAGDNQSHTWSFLQPWAALSTIANTQAYNLPAQFGGLVGDITFSAETAKSPIENVGEANFRRIQSEDPDKKGRPSVCCVMPKDAADTEYPDNPTAFTLHMWPTPDAVYALEYKYVAIQGDEEDSPTATFLGGVQHSETILTSCLSIAEEYAETPSTRYRESFMIRLAASIMLDRRMNTPDNFGPNLDRSDIRGQYRKHSTDYTVSYFDIDGNQVGP